MKYIIFEDFAGHAVPVIFPRRIEHEEMREQMPYSTVLAAGSVTLRDGQFHCQGESTELKARARPEDPEIIQKAFNSGT